MNEKKKTLLTPESCSSSCLQKNGAWLSPASSSRFPQMCQMRGEKNAAKIDTAVSSSPLIRTTTDTLGPSGDSES